MKASKLDTQVFDTKRSHKFILEEENDKSMFTGFWDHKVHLGVFLIYGGISWILISKGYSDAGYAILGVTLLLNSIWVIFRGVPMFCRWFIGLVAMVLIMVGCQHELKEGVIIAKHFEPARDYIYMMPIAHTRMIGKVSSIYYTYIPMPMHDDADYWIEIHGLTEKGKEKTESFYINPTRYESLEIGKTFCVDESCSKEPNEDIKRSL